MHFFDHFVGQDFPRNGVNQFTRQGVCKPVPSARAEHAHLGQTQVASRQHDTFHYGIHDVWMRQDGQHCDGMQTVGHIGDNLLHRR
ncbi:hypothetical protein HRbin36_01222 [bacterium HR36]|nr:hypothetical protein HRbin36_01222 [bacterium HR36]